MSRLSLYRCVVLNKHSAKYQLRNSTIYVPLLLTVSVGHKFVSLFNVIVIVHRFYIYVRALVIFFSLIDKVLFFQRDCFNQISILSARSLPNLTSIRQQFSTILAHIDGSSHSYLPIIWVTVSETPRDAAAEPPPPPLS